MLLTQAAFFLRRHRAHLFAAFPVAMAVTLMVTILFKAQHVGAEVGRVGDPPDTERGGEANVDIIEVE